jgi:predicted aspartyl protease
MSKLRGLAIAVVIGACAHPKPARITVGPQRELLVPVLIKDTYVQMLVDTGASMTTLTPRIKQKLDLLVLDRGSGHGAAGEIEHVWIVMLPHIEVANQSVEMPFMSAAVVDLDVTNTAIDGVLGMDVLGQYVTDVDLIHHQLALHHTYETAWRTPDLVGFPYHTLRGGQIWIDATLDGTPVAAIVDLGANWSFANRQAAPVREEAPIQMRAAIGADRHLATFDAMRDVPVRVGDLGLRANALLIADLPIFKVFGLDDRPAMILGVDLLEGRRLVIAPQEHRVYLSR